MRRENLTPQAASPRSWTTSVTYLFLLLSFVAINVFVTAGFLMTVMMGGVIALLLHPLHHRLVRHRWKSGLAAFTLTLATALILIAPVVCFSFLAVREGLGLAQSISQDGLSVASMSDHLGQLDILKRLGISGKDVILQIQNAAKFLAGIALAFLQAVPQVLLHVLISLLTCLFFLRDGRDFLQWFQHSIPLDPDARRNLFRTFRNTAVSTIFASLIASCVESVWILVAFLMLGIPAAFLAWALAFVFSWIPIVGTSPVWGIGAIFLYTQGRVIPAIALVAIGISGGLLNNFIRAMVIHGRNNLHPMVTLVTILGGIGMFGILGVFFGPILAAVLLSLLDIWPVIGRRYEAIWNTPVTPAPPRPPLGESERVNRHSH